MKQDGWLSPFGEWFPCAYWGHCFKAEAILKERYPVLFKEIDEDYSLYTQKLEELGWIRYKTDLHKWILQIHAKPTASQKDKAFELTGDFI